MANKSTFKDFKEFRMEVLKDAKLQADLKNDPTGTIEKMTQQIPDTKVYRIVVTVLGATIIMIILGVLLAWGFGRITSIDAVPTLLVTTCSAAIGALTAILIPSPNERV